MEAIETSNNNLEKDDNKLKITDFEKQKDQLSDVKYTNVKEFCDSLGPKSVSDLDLKNFVSWVENKFGNEKVELSDGRKYSLWYYLLIYKEIEAFRWNSDIVWQLLKQVLQQDIEPTGWLTFFVCVSALFSVVIVGIPFFIILGEELMLRNSRNEMKVLILSQTRAFHRSERKSPDDFLRYINNLPKIQIDNFKSRIENDLFI